MEAAQLPGAVSAPAAAQPAPSAPAPQTTPTAPEGGAPAGGDPSGAPQADPRVLERMQEQMGQIAGALPALQQLPGVLERFAPQEPAAPREPTLEELLSGTYEPPDPAAGLGPDPYGADPYGQNAPQGIDPSQFAAAVRAEAQRIVSPLQERLERIDGRMTSADIDAVEARYPALRDDPQVRQEVSLAVVQRASAYAQQLGLDQAATERLMHNPSFIEDTYLVREARARAQGEIPAGGSEPGALEPGGGASPGTPEVDPGDAIVAARRPNGGFTF